eukprot:gene4726-biopygen12768
MRGVAERKLLVVHYYNKYSSLLSLGCCETVERMKLWNISGTLSAETLHVHQTGPNGCSVVRKHYNVIQLKHFRLEPLEL